MAPFFSPTPTQPPSSPLTVHLVSWARAAAEGPAGGKAGLGILVWSSWTRVASEARGSFEALAARHPHPAATSISPNTISSHRESEEPPLPPKTTLQGGGLPTLTPMTQRWRPGCPATRAQRRTRVSTNHTFSSARSRPWHFSLQLKWSRSLGCFS